MRCDLANMLRQVRDELSTCAKDGSVDPMTIDTYLASIEQLRDHVLQVRDGTATLEEFADRYMLRPEA